MSVFFSMPKVPKGNEEYGTMGKVGCQVSIRCNNSHLIVWNSVNNMGEGKW